MDLNSNSGIILAAVDDLFFSTKIETTAKALGLRLLQASCAQQLETILSQSSPRLILIDLNSAACEPLETIRRLKSDPRFRETPMVAFFSHVQVELERAALDAGCDRVIPRSQFSAHLADILSSGSDVKT